MNHDRSRDPASRAADLVRMADTPNELEKARLARYAAQTTDPPPMGPQGIATDGCRECRGTLWREPDGCRWTCSGCGHVEMDKAR
ncbi:hypothetical protein ACFVIM_31725 [Streptomyces sp. NPDC057638]|uniref:hypothetical protein n=1 Tax=Streptomyces sp. NPDC057638 TaxID=3346190 RepID=UPI0036948B8C